MRYLYVSVLLLVLLLGAVVVVSLAQNDVCPALVEQALEAIGDNCGGMERNSACYGFNRVNATFSDDVDADFFTQPADRAGLTTMESIETAPLDTELETWGVAVMNVQANVPNTLPGQAVTFLLLGDVRIENAVSADDAFIPADPVAIDVTIAANIRSGSSTNTNVIGSVPVGAALEADGVSPDGNWYRVAFNGGTGWIHGSTIEAVDGLSDLPTISEINRTPMQAFYFSTGTGEPQCNEAPNSVVIQGPNSVVVDINVNGIDISIGSTIVLSTTDNRVQIVTLNGYADVNGLTIPGGFTVFAELDADGNVIPGSVTGFRALTDDELSRYSILENIDGDFLHYDIELPTREDIINTQNAISGGGGGTVGRTGASTIAQVNCSGFVPTSPIGRVTYEAATFFWNPAPGATQYRMTIYAENGNPTQTFLVNAPDTGVLVDPGAQGGGTTFTWQVEALYDSEVACSTAPVTIIRNEPNPDAVQTPFSAGWACSGSGQVVIFWDYLPPNTTLTAYLNDYGPTISVGSSSQMSGSITYFLSLPPTATAGRVDLSNGQSYVLSPGTLNCP